MTSHHYTWSIQSVYLSSDISSLGARDLSTDVVGINIVSPHNLRVSVLQDHPSVVN